MKTLLALFLMTSFFAAAQGTISGKVYESDSVTIVPFAKVMLMQNDSIVQGVMTDLNGNYNFENLSKGAYDLKVSYVGMQGAMIIDVPTNESVDVFMEKTVVIPVQINCCCCRGNYYYLDGIKLRGTPELKDPAIP